MAFVRMSEVLPTVFSPKAVNQTNSSTVLNAAHIFRLEGLDINPAALDRFVYTDTAPTIAEIINLMKPRDYEASPLQINRITAKLHIAAMRQMLRG